MKRKLKWILWLTIYCCSYSQAYTFRNISISDGLSDLLVNTIYKDSTGLIWLGLGNSLDCFDGSHIKHYPVIGVNEVQKRINAITELPGGQILIGNGYGLWHINRQSAKLERIAEDIINCSVKCFLHHNNTLYIGSENGLFIYRSNHIEHLLIHPNELAPANHITGIYAKDDKIWLSTENGLHSILTTTRKINSFYYDNNAEAFTRIIGIDDKIYLGTSTIGLVKFDINTSLFSRYINVGCDVISALSTDNENILYVGTDGNGVHLISTLSDSIVHSYRHSSEKESPLTSNAVYSLLIDRDKLLWIGYYQEGFDYTLYQNSTFTTYPATKGMKVRALAINGAEKLIGTREGLLFTNDETGEKRFFDKEHLNAQMVFSILYHNGKYYIGTYGGGMYTFDSRLAKLSPFMPEDKNLAKGQIYSIQADSAGSLWIGANIGLYQYRNDKLTHYTGTNSQLPAGNVYEIFFDSQGKGWICTETGMCIWDPISNRLRNDIFPEGFFNKEKIRSVYEDSQHQLYFIPDKGAISVSDLSMRNFRRYISINSPLVDKDGQCIIEDNNNNLWIATNNGIYRYERNKTYTSYNFTDGIPSPIFTLTKPIKDNNGDIWFGNTNGLLRLNSASISDKPSINYSAQVTDIRIDGQPIKLPISSNGTPKEISLDKRPGSLTFCISDLCYTDPKYARFEIKLEGVDKDWITINGETDITYYAPSWGEYKFLVRRAGDENSQVSISVYVPMAQNTKYSMFLSAIFVISALAIYYISKKIGIRIRGWRIVIVSSSVNTDDTNKEKGEKYKATYIDNNEKEALLAKLTAIMNEQKLYRRSDLKLADLATAVGTTAQTLSYLFSQHLNSNYYDYINKFRIQEFKHMVETDEYTKYTLSALAELCGFSSRASFFRYFKKETGHTPNEYISYKKGK